MFPQKSSTGSIHICTEKSADKVLFIFTCKIGAFELLCTQVGFCLITALEDEPPYVEAYIPFLTDGIAEMPVYEDVSPDAYGIMAAVVKDIFFKFLYVFFVPRLDEF